MTETPTIAKDERADLLETLAKHRHFLRFTARDLTDEQAVTGSTVSQLCVAGLIKHVTWAERRWADFMVSGPSAMDSSTDEDAARSGFENGFRILPGETLASLLADYEIAARRTDEIVTSLPDLDVSHPLPEAPWFEPGARWSARRVLLHIMAETAQHAGHADIIRESIDGAKTMG